MGDASSLWIKHKMFKFLLLSKPFLSAVPPKKLLNRLYIFLMSLFFLFVSFEMCTSEHTLRWLESVFGREIING